MQPVGRAGKSAVLVTPVNQVIHPSGTSLDLPRLRPQALALSPDGEILAVAGKTHELVVVDPAGARVLQHVALPAEGAREPAPGAVSTHILKPDEEGQVSFTGLAFSPDGAGFTWPTSTGASRSLGAARHTA